jgi:hypothetical protein
LSIYIYTFSDTSGKKKGIFADIDCRDCGSNGNFYSNGSDAGQLGNRIFVSQHTLNLFDCQKKFSHTLSHTSATAT